MSRPSPTAPAVPALGRFTATESETRVDPLAKSDRLLAGYPQYAQIVIAESGIGVRFPSIMSPPDAKEALRSCARGTVLRPSPDSRRVVTSGGSGSNCGHSRRRVAASRERAYVKLHILRQAKPGRGGRKQDGALAIRNLLSRPAGCKSRAGKDWPSTGTECCGSGRQGRKSGEVEVLAPSIARFRRLAYPLRGEVTTCEMRGRTSHGCPAPRGAAVGTTWVASKSRGLKINEWL
jgi:hypothetical protein